MYAPRGWHQPFCCVYYTYNVSFLAFCFQACVESIPFSIMIIRVLREIITRVEEWKPLQDWVRLLYILPLVLPRDIAIIMSV